MSQMTSPGTGKRYGLARVCRVLEFPRATIYAHQARETSKVVPPHPARRGPKPKMADAELLAAIRADLTASPFVGEGHRKVWARLRILCGILVSKDRVRRLMRENALLSPHRVQNYFARSGSFLLCVSTIMEIRVNLTIRAFRA